MVLIQVNLTPHLGVVSV